MSDGDTAEIGLARTGETEAVGRLLHDSGLPDAGVDQLGETLLVARSGDRIVGSAALELYPPAALLRSVAVDPARRGSGLGVELTEAALALARELGLERLFLLTETAAAFFPRFGFRAVAREAVDPAVKRSREFTALCPESAQAMVLELGRGRGGDPQMAKNSL
jgi:amino-acid N-acetyltransferase